ncbi:MAG TPA: PIN domain-containing protein [Verrucomicrobiae bacterium]|jgi:hypothetical protein
MFHLLIDTCVWFDLAKDHQQESLLSVLEELIKQGQISLILPRTVVDEFVRNKARITEDSGRSLSSVLKRVKEAVNKFGEGKGKRIALDQLNEVDYKIPILGEAAIGAIARIEKLFADSKIIELTNEIKLRAAQRAIEKRAPFHKQRNGINDAILIEVYAGFIKDKNAPGIRFAFITHNTSDFSHPNNNNKLPHPDIANYFSKIKSLYLISLGEVLRRVQPELVSDLMIDQEWTQEPRRLTEILEALEGLLDKIWYNRHQNLCYQVEMGKVKIVEKKNWSIKNNARTIVREIWIGARKSAKRMEKKYGVENLGPWSDFEWGMLNGKLSALRWSLGEDWDMLDT